MISFVMEVSKESTIIKGSLGVAEEWSFIWPQFFMFLYDSGVEFSGLTLAVRSEPSFFHSLFS